MINFRLCVNCSDYQKCFQSVIGLSNLLSFITMIVLIGRMLLIIKKPGFIALCWEGQEGGFEGVIQNGWSIVNYLPLLREALFRNTTTVFLDEGDNQIIITQYILTNEGSIETITQELKNAWRNNEYMIKTQISSTTK